MKLFNPLIILLLRFYQKFLSPLLPKACRFEPTCSSYAIGCFKKFSIFKASYLTLKRILRCHPFCEGGFDPVPK